jgi:two-component system cell cycle response regulator DivK
MLPGASALIEETDVAGELILIVEDNEKNLKLARDVLQYRGFRTLEAGTAADGIALAIEHRPDLVLMDIQLPDTDGISALRQLRKEPATRTIPVVALTAFVMETDRQRLAAAGFDGHLAKPIDVKTFAEQVQRYCRSAATEGR